MPIPAHLINIEKDQLPRYLYRIVPLERFLEDCAARRNTLVSPAVWFAGDPYEAAQLRTQLESPLFVDTDGVLSSGLRDDKRRAVGGSWRSSTEVATRVFCQCWSALEESDAIWRLYSPTVSGVKLRVLAEALLSSIELGASEGYAFLGQMDYLPQADLERLVKDAAANHRIQIRTDVFHKYERDLWARCLLRKREQYKHECEVRLMLCDADATRALGAVLLNDYTVDMMQLVDQIELDPREANPIDPELRLRKAGFKGEVRKSRLYQAPELVVRPNWPTNTGWEIGSDRTWKTDGSAGDDDA